MAYRNRAPDALESLLDRLSERNGKSRTVIAAGRKFFWRGATAFFTLAGVAFIVVVSIIGYESLDTSGWIKHNRDTPIWIKGDWMIGEYRNCQMLTTTVRFRSQNRTPRDLAAGPHLFCGDNGESFKEFAQTVVDPASNPSDDATWTELRGQFHIFRVRYNGRINRPGKASVSWRCQRNGTSFWNSATITCWALN